ncbi:hypothetical protein MATL_G00087300 [Megalops atlanticus]|uniref:DBC1/CARP1 catalytically inactive NUDIX hydrolase domain-containing protein n=1 Tax=Megalops atlanticus TaxID=7932 RepID=A0A9D3Q449_MEGAT|nr:hypothetical protein MATL_G00087300 [Megalops atlanticus]
MDPQSKQRVFTGVVTQLQDHYGMVDQEVHFQMSVVIGRIPQLGEKVLVKAVWDPSVSVNWTAQRVQTLNSQPFKSPPPLLPSMAPNQKPGILGSKPQPLLKSPKIPPLIPSMQQNPPKPGLLQPPPHLQSPWGAQYEGWGGGNRKRHNEGMGGRRGGRWEDGGSWGGDGVHQKRRRWRGASEEGLQKKSSPPPPQNCVLLSRFPRDSLSCDSLEVQRRYPHLPLPDSFFDLQLSWTESFPPDHALNLSGPCAFHLGAPQPLTETAPPASSTSAYMAKVMLLSIPTAEELYRQCCSLSQDQETQGGAVHPTTLIKFLLGVSGGELQVLGGRWCPHADGPNPGKDPLVLIRTAVRCVKDQTGLDLGRCSQWHKMAELRYLCGGEVETVVFFLPDVWRIVPTTEELAQLTASSQGEQEEETPPLPEEPSLVVHPCPGITLSTLPLSALLEPQSSQSQDAFEVGLMAELFSEMLQRDFGLQLYHCLCSLPQDAATHCPRPRAEESEDSGTPTADEPEKNDKEKRRSGTKDGNQRRGRREREGDRGSVENLKEEERAKDREERDEKEGEVKDGERAETVGEEGKMHSVTSDNSDSTSTKDNHRPLGWRPVLPRRVLLSWVFFDRQLLGSLREQDLQDILLSLGLHLTPAQVRDLVSRTLVEGHCQYRKLAGRWEDIESADVASKVQGNRALLPSTPVKGGVSTRRASGGSSVDVVTHKGTVLNIPNLLQSLEREEVLRQGLEQRIAALQARLVEAESEAVALKREHGEVSALKEGQDSLRERLERAEKRNSAYERSLKENAGHMIAVIEKMQKLVDKTTSLAESRLAGAENV